MEVRGGTVIAKGSGTEMTTTSHVVSGKHGSHTEYRDHFRARYEWTNPITGNRMTVEFTSDDNEKRSCGKSGLPLFRASDAKK